MPDMRYTAEEQAAYRDAPDKTPERPRIAWEGVLRLRKEHPGHKYFIPGAEDMGSNRIKKPTHSVLEVHPRPVRDPERLKDTIHRGVVLAACKDHGTDEERRNTIDLLAYTQSLEDRIAAMENGANPRRRMKKSS